MKEAAGEASMTGITLGIIAVVAVAAVPLIKVAIAGTKAQTCCTSSGGVWTGGKCYAASDCTYNSNNGKFDNCSGTPFTPECK